MRCLDEKKVWEKGENVVRLRRRCTRRSLIRDEMVYNYAAW